MPADIAALSDWVAFRDYIMEGFVRYELRVVPDARGLLIDIRLSGSNRDQHVAWFVARYAQWAGCEAVAADGNDG